MILFLGSFLVGASVALLFWWPNLRKRRNPQWADGLCERCFLKIIHAPHGPVTLCYQCSHEGRRGWMKE